MATTLAHDADHFTAQTSQREQAPSERAPLIHLSAVIAWGTYIAGLSLAVATTPGMLFDLVQGGAGPIALGGSFGAFMLLIAMIQRHMGTALTENKTLTPPRLCTSGIFKYSRNPIYLAFILPISALAIYSIAAAAVTVACYVVATTLFVIRGEETFLREKFGADYVDYLHNTPRWLIV